MGTPFSFAVLSTLLCFLQIFPFILFCLDSSTIYLSYPSTIFLSYRAGGAVRINWSDFFFDGVGQFYCPLTALHSRLPLLSVTLACGSPSALLQPFRSFLTETPLPSANTFANISKYQQGSRIGDFHPISSRPCQAYTTAYTLTSRVGRLLHLPSLRKT